MSEMYIGQLIPFAGNFAIRGYAMCNGQLLSIQQNTALFSILGTTYGGNGQNNFQLPDLRSRHMVHFGQGNGLSDYQLGQVGGTENVSILINNMPSHTHLLTGTLNASTTKATAQLPAAGSVLGHADDISGNTTPSKPAIYLPTPNTTNAALGGWTGTAANTGGNIPVGILDPYLAVNIQIVMQGIFPSRN